LGGEGYGIENAYLTKVTVVCQFNNVFRFKFEEDKALSALLYISRALLAGRFKSDLHKIFKIMYFADMKHMVRYGRSITKDFYIAMADGPVPSQIYDIAKAVRGDSKLCVPGKYAEFFEVRGKYIVVPKIEPNMEELSRSDIECINESLRENQGLSYTQLKRKSHDKAYDNADGNRNSEISPKDIAKVGGADERVLVYIQETSRIQ
jgi:uncharacterized phage-associated protein